MAKSTWIGSEYVGSDGVKTGETRSPGLFTDKDGKTYLLDSSYQPVTGWQELDSSWYYFVPRPARWRRIPGWMDYI